MKSLRIHGPLDLRIEDYQVDNLGANQVEIHIAIFVHVVLSPFDVR